MSNSKTMKNIRLTIMSVLVLVVGGYLLKLGSTPFDIFSKKSNQVETPALDTPTVDLGKIKVSEFNDTMKLQAALEKKTQLEEKATLHNDIEAMMEIGRMYEGESLGQKDLKQATYWFKKAADAGNVDAALHVQALELLQRFMLESDEEIMTSSSASTQNSVKAISPDRLLQIAGMEQSAQTEADQKAQDLIKELEALLGSAEKLSISMTKDSENITSGLKTPEIADEIESEFLEKPQQTQQQTLSGSPLKRLGDLLDSNSELEKQAAAEKLERLKAMPLDELEVLANTGDALAQNQLGLKYHKIELDRSTALKWFKKAADGGVDEGITNADKMIEYEEVSNTDRAAMISWMHKLGEKERAPAQLLLGTYYNAGVHGLPRDRTIGYGWIEKAANNGSAKAQYDFGNAQLSGTDISANKKSGFTWLNKSAKQEYSQAYFSIARSYHKGIGVEQDHVAALNWYGKAHDADNSSAALRMLMIYWDDKSPAKNDDRAREIAEFMITKNNSSVGHLYAGDMYLAGRGYPQNDKLAFEHYQNAANQDYDRAQYKLALMLLDGRGTVKNKQAAIEWLQKANANFSYEASVKLKELGINPE